jgi:hypothetical protein
MPRLLLTHLNIVAVAFFDGLETHGDDGCLTSQKTQETEKKRNIQAQLEEMHFSILATSKKYKKMTIPLLT